MIMVASCLPTDYLEACPVSVVLRALLGVDQDIVSSSSLQHKINIQVVRKGVHHSLLKASVAFGISTAPPRTLSGCISFASLVHLALI